MRQRKTRAPSAGMKPVPGGTLSPAGRILPAWRARRRLHRTLDSVVKEQCRSGRPSADGAPRLRARRGRRRRARCAAAGPKDTAPPPALPARRCRCKLGWGASRRDRRSIPAPAGVPLGNGRSGVAGGAPRAMGCCTAEAAQRLRHASRVDRAVPGGRHPPARALRVRDGGCGCYWLRSSSSGQRASPVFNRCCGAQRRRRGAALRAAGAACLGPVWKCHARGSAPCNPAKGQRPLDPIWRRGSEIRCLGAI